MDLRLSGAVFAFSLLCATAVSAASWDVQPYIKGKPVAADQIAIHAGDSIYIMLTVDEADAAATFAIKGFRVVPAVAGEGAGLKPEPVSLLSRRTGKGQVQAWYRLKCSESGTYRVYVEEQAEAPSGQPRREIEFAVGKPAQADSSVVARSDS